MLKFIRVSSTDWVVFVVLLILVCSFQRSLLKGRDQASYWSQFTSLWYDRDLVLHDDLLANWNDPAMQLFSIVGVDLKTGALNMRHSIGPAIVAGAYAGPMVSLMSVIERGRLRGPVLNAIALGNILMLWILYYALRGFMARARIPARARKFSFICILVGTPLIVYSFRLYAMSHHIAAVMASLFVLIAVSWLRSPTSLKGIALGIAAGLLVIIRWQDILYGFWLIPPLAYRLVTISRPGIGRLLRSGGIALAMAFLVGLCQVLAWHNLFGGYPFFPPRPYYMRWDSPELDGVLFSGLNGLIPWSPIVILSFIGITLGCFVRPGVWRWIFFGAILTTIASIYTNASTLDWWSGSRRLISLTPLFVLGLGETFRLVKRPSLWIIVTVLTCAWATLTLSISGTGTQDLAIPILGRPSLMAPPQYQTQVGRQVPIETALKKMSSTHLNQITQFVAVTNMHRLQRTIIIILALPLAILVKRCFEAVGRRRRMQRLAIGGAAIYLSGCVLVLATMPSDAKRLNGVWLDYLQERLTPEETKEQGVPPVAVDFIEGIFLAPEKNLEHKPPWESYSTDIYPNMTRHAFLDIQRMWGHIDLRAHIEKVLEKRPIPVIWILTIRTIGSLGPEAPEEARQILRMALEDSNEHVRREAAEALEQVENH